MFYPELRRVSTGAYNQTGYTTAESIAQLQITEPVKINSFLTYNLGKNNSRFPILFLTEGRGKKGVKDIVGVEWTWDIMGRQQYTDRVTHFNAADATPGKGGVEFEVHFATHLFIEQYGLIAPDGKTKVRIQKDLGESPYGYAYLLRIVNPNPELFVSPENLVKGKYWSMTAPTVTHSFSEGNRSNTFGPGKMRGQLSVHRYSDHLSGNAAHIATNYQFDNGNGGTTNLWMSEAHRQFNERVRFLNEEELWYSEYNRDASGKVLLIDRGNGQPITKTAGLLEIARENGYDTYGEFLTVNKINRIISDVTDTAEIGEVLDLVFLGGKGLMEDFDLAFKRESTEKGFLNALGEKEINGDRMAMEYGAYFRSYKTIDGHRITIKHCDLFDKGTVAEAAKKNGRVHPRTLYPITSHSGVIVDFTTYQGEQNVRLVRKKGQIYKVGIYKGMTDIPANWGINVNNNQISTTKDMASYELMTSMGLQINDNSKMFYIECVL